MPFTIYYENDPDLGATAPAQVVLIEDQLDNDLDWATFELGDMNPFGDFWIDVPDGLNYYEALVDLRPQGNDLLLQITAELDSGTGKVTWLFESLDPVTLALPDDPMAGFLPVNDKAVHDGEGRVTYTVRPLPGLPTGTAVTNQAFNTFDVNDPVATPTTLNTVDAGAPASSVLPLPAVTTTTDFLVEWSGQDDVGGSGIAGYDVYVSTDAGAYTLWLDDTVDTSATFSGQNGHAYAFYSVATDNVGHVEPDTQQADTQTILGAGNVVAKVVNGNLKITGDALDNDITVTQGLTANQFVITGNGTTTVNGLVADTLVGVTKSFNVKLKGGDDAVKLDSLTVPNKLIVNTGAGDDRVELENVNVLGRTNINTGWGNDDVLIDPTVFDGKANIKTGAGKDMVELAEAIFKGRASLVTGSGADTVTVSDSDFLAKVNVKTGSGDDTVELANSSTFAARCDVKTSGGADHIWITESDFDKKLKLILGGGTDWLTEQDCVLTGGAMANGGWGKDTYEYIGLGTSGVNRKSFEVFV